MKLYDSVQNILDQKGREVWSVGAEAPVFEAILRMSQAHVGALLVLDKGKLAGIISERDYARNVTLESRSSRETLVREIMTTQVMSVETSSTVDECMQLMTDHHIRHLPVLEGERIVGVISIGDLVGWIMSAHVGMVEQLTNYIAGSYPA